MWAEGKALPILRCAASGRDALALVKENVALVFEGEGERGSDLAGPGLGGAGRLVGQYQEG